MALLSKVVDGSDSRQLTVRGTFSSEPFPNAAASGYMMVVDERNSPWKFTYKISGNKRILSGQWELFFGSNEIKVGDEVAFHKNEGWGPQADYMIEVIRKGSD
ncbi:hypothetical protein V6N13_108626 [Hibiscus sabdariffa]|uniref:TF-B3 domain-containing protein n=1 Tax=Hibiscus sabdariffa TaxID=183260 RepID=A0ABR2SSP4_9ROSI